MAAKTQKLDQAPDTGKQKPALRAIKKDLDVSLDRVIHERTRLAIVSALAVSNHLTFNELKAALDISDGNLSAHARKLEDAGYINCKKDFDGRTPRTRYALSAAGRKALNRYVEHMESLIRAVKNR